MIKDVTPIPHNGCRPPKRRPVSYTHLDVYKRQEPYKGKGIKYADEHIRRKEGKAGGKGKK